MQPAGHKPDSTDHPVAIIGDGIAALWTATHLAGLGHRIVLIINPATLGGTQSLASQGIIHGGVKYALTGAQSRASLAISAMPEIWRASLQGTGPIDLRAARVLSPHQWMFSTGSLAGRLTALIGSKAMRTPMHAVGPHDPLCPGLRPARDRGQAIYIVEEPVLDARSIALALLAQAQLRGVSILPGPARFDGHTLLAADTPVHARAMLLCAGAGNAPLIGALGHDPARFMQTRPLHMVIARGPNLPQIFGHCVAALSDKPRLTLGTQPSAEPGAEPSHRGHTTWYLGGQLAESGVTRDRPAQIAAAIDELRTCLPWIDLTATTWATARWDRAEGLTPDGSRPDEPVITPIPTIPSTWAAWPTKLAFAPLLAERLAATLADAGIAPAAPTAQRVPPFHGVVAPLPWDEPGLEWTTP